MTFLGMERLDDLETRLEDILQRRSRMPMVDSRTIGYIAAKHHFDPIKEQRLIQKAGTTRCKCKHNTFTKPTCLYRSCRHNQQNHFAGVALL
jgi:hypothetical protein